VKVFADTVGLLALWDRSDQWHHAAESAFCKISEQKALIYTTTFVLLECANASARRPYRLNVNRLRIQLDRGGYLIQPTSADWQQAWEAYDKGNADRAGVVDHISFMVMRRSGISLAFTNDSHFRSAGFETLF